VTFITRSDYAFPFRLDGTSQRAAQTSYARHVEGMLAQILLTTPGERADLPQFGCALRQLVFAPLDESVRATLHIQVTQALGQWLAGVIEVNDVTVATSEDNASLLAGTVEVTVSYTLVDSQASQQTTVALL
jgi:phage baseplate assembly protein W